MFHTCIILLHQPYLTQAYDNPKIEANQGPIKTCLTASTTITDIAKTTRQFDKKALCNFQYPIYGITQSAIMEMVIMNGSADHAQDAKKAMNDTVEELRWAAENSNFGYLKEMVKELEGIMMITNGGAGNNHLSIPLPLVIQMLEQNNNNLQKSSLTATSNNDNNNTTPNTSTTSQYSDDNFMDDSMKAEYSSSSIDSSTTISDSESSPIRLSTTTNETSNTSNLQDRSQQQSTIQLQQRSQLQNQQITPQQPPPKIQSQFMMSPTSSSLFNTSPPQNHTATSTTSTAAPSLHQQFQHLSSPFGASGHHDNNHQISQPDNNQWDPFYIDVDGNEFLFDGNNVNTAPNQVMDDLSLYPAFNTYSDN